MLSCPLFRAKRLASFISVSLANQWSVYQMLRNKPDVHFVHAQEI